MFMFLVRWPSVRAYCNTMVVIFTITLLAFLSLLLYSLSPPSNNGNSKPHKLPPGPTIARIPILGRLMLLNKPWIDLQPLIRDLHAKLGPLISLPMGPSGSTFFISDHSLAHKSLIQDGAVFADRPKESSTGTTVINTAAYGPTWRVLRRNLTSGILHAARLPSHSGSRSRVLRLLIDLLGVESRSKSSVRVTAHFEFAMFSLLCLMCFGRELDERTVREIEAIQRKLLLSLEGFQVINCLPSFVKIFFYKRWGNFMQLRREQEDLLLPLIRACKNAKTDTDEDHHGAPSSYLETLVSVKLPVEEEGKKLRELEEKEVVSLCSEFLNAGTDTTITALEWIMANLVKYPEVQDKLFAEMSGVLEERVGKEEVVEVEDLKKMPYLKAVVLEGLRRHPPGHFVLSHSVTEDVVIDGYRVPKNSSVNYSVAEMGRDPKVWEDPMAFKPERFMKGDGGGVNFDVTGSKEIKMMPFGVGRRMCPAYDMAMLHLEYFVGNLVWRFEWKAVEGEEIDLSEKEEFTVVMKNHLHVNLVSRTSNHGKI